MARHTPQLACRSPKKHFVRSISQVCQCSFSPCRDMDHPVTAHFSRWLSGNGNSLAIFGCHGVFEFSWRELPSRPAYLHPAMGAESFLWFLGPAIDHKSMFLHSVEQGHERRISNAKCSILCNFQLSRCQLNIEISNGIVDQESLLQPKGSSQDSTAVPQSHVTGSQRRSNLDEAGHPRRSMHRYQKLGRSNKRAC